MFEGEGPGAKVTMPFDVPEDGDYELYAQMAKGSDYGVYTVLLDGKPPVAPVLEHEPGADVRPQTQFDGYALETQVGVDYQVGWPRLTKGRHTLTFVCLGKREDSSGFLAGVDDIVLARTGPAAWAAGAKTQEPRVPTGGAAELGKSLSDPDPVTRGLAAMGLVKLGPAALPALPQLTAALKDADPNVRLMSANAIAAIGKDAAPAVPALIAACSVEGEQIHVLRACASALGAIGKPAATPALPVLKKLAEHPRIRWAAEAAIKKIQ